MPTDPKTGERLPYPGEPGFKEEATKDAPAPEADDADKRAADLMATIDEELAKREGKPEEGEEAAPKEEGEEAEGAEDLKPLEETLGITPERARMLFDAAQQLAKTEGKTPQELADMIAGDFEILMQLEMIAARGDEGEPEEGMPAPEEEAAGMPPAMPPGMAPQGGM
jgi:hypothetical protein